MTPLTSSSPPAPPPHLSIFNTSLETCHVSFCFKTVHKKARTTGFNDYRPVTLTSVLMKSFERLVLSHIKVSTDPLLDPLQFVYRAKRSVDNAVNMTLHGLLHPQEPMPGSCLWTSALPSTPSSQLCYRISSPS